MVGPGEDRVVGTTVGDTVVGEREGISVSLVVGFHVGTEDVGTTVGWLVVGAPVLMVGEKDGDL